MIFFRMVYQLDLLKIGKIILFIRWCSLTKFPLMGLSFNLRKQIKKNGLPSWYFKNKTDFGKHNFTGFQKICIPEGSQNFSNINFGGWVAAASKLVSLI
jgi:hypothetical protein